jgi:hypothetical protein
MKQFKQTLASAFWAAVMLIVFVVGFTAIFRPDAIAQIVNRQPTPTLFVDYTGTNWVAVNASAGLEVRKAGTIYTGGSTNIALTNAFKLQFVNGVYAGAVPLTQ